MMRRRKLSSRMVRKEMLEKRKVPKMIKQILLKIRIK
jgi:hypothetical protein